MSDEFKFDSDVIDGNIKKLKTYISDAGNLGNVIKKEEEIIKIFQMHKIIGYRGENSDFHNKLYQIKESIEKIVWTLEFYEREIEGIEKKYKSNIYSSEMNVGGEN